MSENFQSIIDQDWSDLAIDDGTFLDSFNGYEAKLFARDVDETITSQVENISYSPEVNSVKGISVDVEPNSDLEGTKYLGGIVDVFVNGEPLFSGEIFKINTSQNGGEYYTIEAEAPPKKIRDETINETTDNYILSDFIAKTIDKYNSYDDEHFNLVNTSQENFGFVSSSTLTEASHTPSDVSVSESYVAYGSFDNNVYVHSLSDGSLKYTLTQATGSVNGVALTDDRIAYGPGSGNNVYVHDLSDGSLEYSLSEFSYGIDSVSISDSYVVYLGIVDDNVYIHDLSDGSLSFTLSEASTEVNSVSLDSEYILYSTDDNTYLHNISGGVLLA